MIHTRYHHLFMMIITGLTIAGFMAALTGCGPGLPKELKEDAKAIPGAVKTGKSRVDTQKEKYTRLSKSPEFKEVALFAEKENWAQQFSLAHDALERAGSLYEKELTPLVSENKPELAAQVKEQIARINKIIQDAQETAQYPFSRFSNIKETIKKADTLPSQAKGLADQINRIADQLNTGPIQTAIDDFPDLTEKINTRVAPLSKLQRQARENLAVVTEEYAKHASGAAADYAAFTDSMNALSSGLEQSKILEKKLTREMAQLYSGYTKILKDMKEDYFVTIKRESWDENSDYYDPRTVTFQRQVSLEVYEAITADNLETIATITPGFMGSKFSSQIGDLWKELNINPAEQWPGRGHNAASFWVEDSSEAYYHKYILEENGETRETDWEKVDESVYDADFEFLGMAILAKPYGTFEQDRLTQAAPPGMAYVGNPKYGEWKDDDKGDRFWSWYGKYAFFSSLFFFPPSYYHYNSWMGWHNNYRYQKPYFGKTRDGFQKYGTSGTVIKQSPRFQSTSFVKSGGLRSQTASVRGAGASLRGGGPKSKGK